MRLTALALAIGMALATITPTHAVDQQTVPAPTWPAATQPNQNFTPRLDQIAQACCKVCRKGKACGNTCISRAYTCTRPPGCACDAR